MSNLTQRWRKSLELGQAALAVAGLILFWEVACRALQIPSWLLPAPSQIVYETWEIRAIIPRHFLATLYSVVGGFTLAVVTGIPIAVMVVYSPFLRRVIYPFLLVLQSVPKVAMAPLLVLWVGYGLQSNMVVAAITAFFPIVINTATGLNSVDPELLELTRSLDSGKLRVFWRVRLPWALPYIFSAMKVSITLAVIGTIVAEFIGSDRGLGYLILTSSGTMRTSLMFGIIVVLSSFGIACFYLVIFAERILCPWYLPVEPERTQG